MRLKPPYVRTRDDSSVLPVTLSQRSIVIRKSDGVVLSDTPSTGTVLLQKKRRMTDTVTPGYQELVAGGAIINSPMSSVTDEVTLASTGFSGVFDASGYTNRQEYTATGPFIAYFLGLPGLPSDSMDVGNLINLAETGAMAGMKNSSFQGLVALAEFKKTLDFVRNPLSALNEILGWLLQLRAARENIRIVSRGKIVIINGRRFLRPGAWYHNGPGRLVKLPDSSILLPFGGAISGLTLGYNLGCKPLMMDINALMHEIPNLHRSERLSSRKSVESSKISVANDTLRWSSFTIPVETQSEVSVRVRSSLFYQDRFDVLQDFGVSLYDIPSTAWELIPASFVADYFANIGNFLDATYLSMSKNILAYSCVVKRVDRATRKALGVSASNFTVTRAIGGTDVIERTTVERSVTLRGPALAYRPLRGAFRAPVVQNLLSLITQKLIKLAR